MEKPIINLNGDRAETLTQGYTKARRAVSDALAALFECTPHGRNYPMGNDSYRLARGEHGNRIIKLGKILRELQDLEFYCSEFIK